MSEPSIILVRPQMAENIGAAARAMLNFGLTRMRLVAPRDGWPSEKATAMASGAGRILDQAGQFPDVASAVEDFDYVFATTARERYLTKPVMTPERAMAHARTLIGEGKRCAVMFGPERAGLENEDLVRANALVRVPVNPEFPSLNLAQCTLLLAYEWMRQTDDTPPEALAMAGTEVASQIEVEHLAQHFEEKLEDAGDFFPDQKAAGMKLNLRNLWSRLPLTRADVQMLHGALRQLTRAAKQDD